MADVDQLLGARIGHLRIVDRLGEGGVGAVYVGVHEKLGRRVALKALRDRHRLDPDARARFLREAQILSQVSHPNICQIHDYVEGDEVDLLVLELVEGRNLRLALLEDLGDSERLEIAEQVLAALAAAHQRGIVHRDLKPENVMVTPAGEVKVLDFGLARTVDEATPTVASLPSAERWDEGDGSRFRTRVGLVTGTVDYMSPEQARGEPATPAGDVYSLGLMLQELFTGRAPDTAGSLPDRLERAQRGESAPIAGIDPDLAGLIERMKAPSPGARPSAIDALERLRWIRGKRRRRMRRMLLAGFVGLLAMLALLLAWQAWRAAEARARAERAWEEAEALSAFMLEDLLERLRPLGRLDLLDRVADEARRYYQGIPPEMRSPQRRYRHALALRNLGQVLELEGEWGEAEATYREVVGLATALAAEAPGDERHQRGVRRAWDDLGDVLLEQGRLDEAEAAFRRSLALVEAEVAADPDDPRRQAELSDVWDDLGGLHQRRGDLDQAMEAFRTALAVDRRLTAWDPRNAHWQSNLGRSLHRLGTVHGERGDLAAARAAFEETLAVDRALVAADPANAEHQLNLSQALFDVSRVTMAQGDAPLAARRLDEALAIDRRLVAQDPSNARWRDSLGRALIARGDLLRAAGEAAGARAAWRDARAVLASFAEAPRGDIYRRRYEEAAQRLAGDG